MPTNLPAEAKHKWHEASQTRNPKDKIEKLAEFLSLVPKHKGTENLRAQVKRKIALLRREIEDKKHKPSRKGGSRFFIEKEGDAQIVILGPTNGGRSSLLSLLTNAKVMISNQQYTTKKPIPGMFHYQDLQFQMVEAPALRRDSAENMIWGLQTLATARNADGLVIMVDLSQNPREQLGNVLRELEKARILTSKPKARIDVERKHAGAGLRIILLGRLINCTVKEIEQLLKSYKIRDANVKVQGEATIEDIEDAIFGSVVHRPAIVVANKIDLPKTRSKLRELKTFINGHLELLPVSCKTGFGLTELGPKLFAMLNIIRIYTKEPHHKSPSLQPTTVGAGSTISDLALRIHSDFYEQFSFARVWSERLQFSPQKVGKTFILKDGDIVEIHTK